MDFEVPQQDMFFYRGKWTREMDVMLLSTLISLRRDRTRENGNVPDDVLRSLCSIMKPPFGADLTSEEISICVQLLRARHKRFKKLIQTK